MNLNTFSWKNKRGATVGKMQKCPENAIRAAIFAVTCFIKGIFSIAFWLFNFLRLDFPLNYQTLTDSGSSISTRHQIQTISMHFIGLSCELNIEFLEILRNATNLTWLASRPRFSNRIRFSMLDFLLLSLNFHSTPFKRCIFWFISVSSRAYVNEINTERLGVSKKGLATRKISSRSP